VQNGSAALVYLAVVISPGRFERATASKNDSASRQLGLSPLVSVGGRDSSSDPLGHESSSGVLP
jgi:hypothetical protein